MKPVCGEGCEGLGGGGSPLSHPLGLKSRAPFEAMSYYRVRERNNAIVHANVLEGVPANASLGMYTLRVTPEHGVATPDSRVASQAEAPSQSNPLERKYPSQRGPFRLGR